jgi:hypothetical protein
MIAQIDSSMGERLMLAVKAYGKGELLQESELMECLNLTKKISDESTS